MNKFIKLILALILVPALLQAQVSGSELVGLGMESSLASKVASIGNGSRVRASAGTVALPSYSFSTDIDTGLFSVGANSLGVAVGGAGELTVTNTAIAPYSNGGLDLGGASVTFSDAYLSNNIILSSSSAEIKSNTSDAADNKVTNVCGGGDDSNTRGSFLTLSGNESGPAGNALLSAGNATGAYVQIAAPNATGFNRFDVAGAEVWRMNASGGLVGAGTGSAGWAVVDGTDNTACTSQCTAPAVFGFNLSAGATAPVIVSASDATADICLCAGAS